MQLSLCLFQKHVGRAASTARFQSSMRFVNALTGHINGFGVDVDVGGVAEIKKGL